MQKAGFDASERIKKVIKDYTQEQAVDVNFVEAKARKKYKDFLKAHQAKLVAENKLISDLQKYIANLKSEIEVERIKKKLEERNQKVEDLVKERPVYEQNLAQQVADELAPFVVGSRSFKSTLVPVKNAIPGTELARYEARIKAINKRIRTISKALKLKLSNIELADQEVLELVAIPDKTKRERALGNLFGKLVRERADLQERMYMNVPQEVKETTTPLSQKPDIKELYARTLPKQYGEAFRKIEEVEPKLARAKRDRKSTRLNSSHIPLSRMPSSA